MTSDTSQILPIALVQQTQSIGNVPQDYPF